MVHTVSSDFMNEEKLAGFCDEAASYLKKHFGNYEPRLILALGSGWGDIVHQTDINATIPYQSIPYFPITRVPGHQGELLFASVKKHPIAILRGRAHFYEGHSFPEVAFPILLLAKLGARIAFLTNASGGVNLNLKPGNLVSIRDHLNLMGHDPLRGFLPEKGMPLFLDQSFLYSQEGIKVLQEVAQQFKIFLCEGTYGATSGPCYETPAEISMLRTLGADIVGMSTVPEAIFAYRKGLKVVALSCVANMGSGINQEPITHEIVLRNLEMGKEQRESLVLEAIVRLLS